ncbi:hypothetical protein ACO22_07670 [Paracoccidioides brasiliensis]|uniref:DUF4939 domain-containing protein n=1 Tax=Paracoccidioides brasiliensis TaxID=121759 RepID=A0A1D2J3Y7_PARBR|nr:hypothetical protein ACO22_07670 [Paracoccidioides brasiliensis]
MALQAGSAVDRSKRDTQELVKMNEALTEKIKMLEFAMVIRGIKMNPPVSFSGEQGKLQVFLAQMDVYLTANASKVMSEVDKVLIASTYLSEAVFDWFKPRVRK